MGWLAIYNYHCAKEKQEALNMTMAEEMREIADKFNKNKQAICTKQMKDLATTHCIMFRDRVEGNAKKGFYSAAFDLDGSQFLNKETGFISDVFVDEFCRIMQENGFTADCNVSNIPPYITVSWEKH